MAEKITRPDPSLVKKLLKQAQSVDTQLKVLADARQPLKDAVLEALKPVLAQRVDQILRDMDVEQLNMSKQGLRVQLLTDAGIENVLQVAQMTFRQICAIHGLGEQSAQKIRDTVLQIKANARKTARIRLSPEQKTPADTALVRSLYQYVHCDPLCRQAADLYDRHHGPMAKEAASLKAAKGLGWLFASAQKKQQAVSAAASLESRLTGELSSLPDRNAFLQVRQRGTSGVWEDFAANSARYYAALESIDTTLSRYETEKNGLPSHLAEQIAGLPLDLSLMKATLRNYQTFGTQYILHQERVLLGDQMGLGKTIQALGAMAALAAEGKSHFMVVCPAGVLINWCREIPQHSHLKAIKLHGDYDEPLSLWLKEGGVAVTTFEAISRFSLPETFSYHMLVVDEAHYVKNPETLRTRSLKTLLPKTDRVLFMSGTPLENRVDEMCALVKLLQPQVAARLEGTKYISTAQQFRQQLAPVYLRRTREDVLQELPEKSEMQLWCEMGAAEKDIYRQAVESENFMAMRQVSWQVDDLTQSSKANRLLEICDEAREDGRKVIVFSFFRSTLEKVSSLLADRCMQTITGSVSPQRRQEIVDEFTAAPAGAVLVSQVQAGGTGLNIQCANVVIFCEPQIKPSIENQAVSRAYRMGQTRDVLVYRLLCEDTVDEQILELLEIKQEQFDSFAEDSVIGLENLRSIKDSEWIAQAVEKEKQRFAQK